MSCTCYNFGVHVPHQKSVQHNTQQRAVDDDPSQECKGRNTKKKCFSLPRLISVVVRTSQSTSREYEEAVEMMIIVDYDQTLMRLMIAIKLKQHQHLISVNCCLFCAQTISFESAKRHTCALFRCLGDG